MKVKNYKSFGNDPQGFETILPVNLIIGKNNAGKSALLDAVDFAVAKQNILQNLYNKGNTPELLITKPLSEGEIQRAFPAGTSGGQIGGNYFEYGKNWIDKPVTYLSSFTSDHTTLVSVDPPFTIGGITSEFGPKLASELDRIFADYVIRRVAADRDIRPEKAVDGCNLSSDGTGATNVVRFCLQDADANAGPLIKKGLLTALNYVFEGETEFTDIVIMTRGDMWEIYLMEAHKEDGIPISNSGSGLKTIILVLLQLLVMPHFIQARGSEYFLYQFEEIENNLHPGLVRNLISFIRAYAKENGSTFFITTHSSVMIDLFDKDPDAQILHVTHDKVVSRVNPTKYYLDKKGIIEDLDVRSSDILQSNAVVWVEGPSDRTYINHWISLYSNGDIREGEHYQCVYYGGKLLARVSADPDNSDEANILKVNTNAILVMDSDIVLPEGTINKTKARMSKEVEAVNGVVWTTDGKEIENYLPKELLEGFYGKTTSRSFTKHTKIQSFLNNLSNEAGNIFVQKKQLYAERFIELYTKEMLEADEELTAHIAEICKALTKWNGIKKPEV